MGRIVATEFISLDGVIEDPGGSEDFKHGGWSFEISRGEEGDRFKLDETMGSDALLLGRVTYEGLCGGVAVTRRRVRRQVQQHAEVRRLDARGSGWTNSTVIAGDELTEAVARIKDEHDGEVVVHGSAQLVQALLDNDLLDELRLMVFPVVLGSGKRLWGESSDKTRLRLVDSRRSAKRASSSDLRPLARQHAAGEVDHGARVDVVAALVIPGGGVVDHGQHELLA